MRKAALNRDILLLAPGISLSSPRDLISVDESQV